MKCSRLVRSVTLLAQVLVALFAVAPAHADCLSVSLEPGQYSDYLVGGPFTGMMREDGTRIGVFDNPSVFGSPEHTQADFLWFSAGFMTWQYPVSLPSDAVVECVSYTVEVSSEYPGANFDWPSDLTVAMNGVPIGTFRIPGDPGRPAGMQENHLSLGSTQFGWLLTWTVDGTGTYLEANFRDIPARGLGPIARYKISNVTVNDLNILPGQPIAVKLSVPAPWGATGHGGLNIFGDTWGDYDVDPTVTVCYHHAVTLDIKPGSFPNSINLHARGTVPVAILSTALFDAATVDVSTVALAGAPVKLKPNGTPMASLEDVNGDGVLDLVLHFDTQALQLTSADTQAVLTGLTLGGATIQGSDSVRIVR